MSDPVGGPVEEEQVSVATIADAVAKAGEVGWSPLRHTTRLTWRVILGVFVLVGSLVVVYAWWFLFQAPTISRITNHIGDSDIVAIAELSTSLIDRYSAALTGFIKTILTAVLPLGTLVLGYYFGERRR